MLACGMITAPRSRNTISNSIASFGYQFFEPLHVFAEPDVGHFLHESKCIVHRNESKLGCFWNWVGAAKYLLANTSEAFIMLMEDDIEFVDGAAEKLQEFLEELPGDCSGISPYTALPNGHKEPGWGRAVMHRRNQFYGALCIVIPRDALIRALDYYTMLNYNNNRHLDTSIGYALTHRDFFIYNHSPTLVYHTGAEVSTLIPEGHPHERITARKPFTG